MQRPVALLACVALLLMYGVARGGAQSLTPKLPLLDQLEIVHLDRDLVALGAAGGDTRVRLELDERLVWTGTRGLVGAAVTNRRLLLVAAGRGIWQQVRFLRDEEPSTGAWVGERVVLAHTSRRVLGFSAIGGNVSEYRLGPNEHLVAVEVAEGVGVALTDRKALGFSSRLGNFSELSLGVREHVESLDVSAELATVTTVRRLLVFRGTGGVWGDRRRELGGS
jgi:hypothetical protein